MARVRAYDAGGELLDALWASPPLPGHVATLHLAIDEPGHAWSGSHEMVAPQGFDLSLDGEEFAASIDITSVPVWPSLTPVHVRAVMPSWVYGDRGGRIDRFTVLPLTIPQGGIVAVEVGSLSGGVSDVGVAGGGFVVVLPLVGGVSDVGVAGGALDAETWEWLHDFATDMTGITVMANSTAGAITHSSGSVLIDGSVGTCGLYAQEFDAVTQSGVYVFRGINGDAGGSATPFPFYLMGKAYTDRSNVSDIPSFRVLGVAVFGSNHTSTPSEAQVNFYGPAGSGNALQPDGTFSGTGHRFTVGDGDWYEVHLETDAVNERRRIRFRSALDDVQSVWIDFADMRAPSANNLFPIASSVSNMLARWDSIGYRTVG